MITILWLKIFRVIIIGIGYIIMCLRPESSISFFKTLFIFSGGLLYDYSSLACIAYTLKNKSNTRYNYQRKIAALGIAFSIAFFILSILGLYEIVKLEIANNRIALITTPNLMLMSAKIDFTYLLKFMGILPLMTVFEIFNKHERVVMTTETAL